MHLLNKLAIVAIAAATLSFAGGIHAQASFPCSTIQLYPAKTVVQVGEPTELIVTTGYSIIPFTQLPIIFPPGYRVYYQVSVTVDNSALPVVQILEPDIFLFSDPKKIKSFRVPMTFDSPGLKRISISTPNGSRSDRTALSTTSCLEDIPATASTEIFVEAKPVVAPLAIGYSGLWWNPKTNGQGVFVAQNTPSNIAYLGWFTYDQTGVARWYVGDNCYVQNNSCTTTIYETKGATFDGINFNSSNLKPEPVGTATVTFASNQAATMVYSLKSSGGKLDLVRQPY